MLASQSAWTILRAEHFQMRQRLASIAEAQGAVQRGALGLAVPRLRQLIQAFQAFDVESHRPKGVALRDALRGRSPEADRLLTALELEREQDDALLAQALEMLDAVVSGEESAAVEFAAVLAHHRERSLRHLHQEDTLLCAHSEQLLTDEEWSRVVSDISSALYPAGPQPVSEANDHDSLA